jgi:cytidylate kinase
MATSADQPKPRIITVSATYGAGGIVVGPRLAERLALPFLDRLIQVAGATPGPRSEEGLSDEERAQTPLSRLVAHLVRLPSVLGTPVPEPGDIPDRDKLRAEADASINDIASGKGGVVLGRAAAVVLANHPSAFHVRLDGPVEARVTQALAMAKKMKPFEPFDEETARRHLAETDRARTLYVQRLYDRDPDDPHLYHLVVDSTALPLDTCVDLVATAANAFWKRSVSKW